MSVRPLNQSPDRPTGSGPRRAAQNPALPLGGHPHQKWAAAIVSRGGTLKIQQAKATAKELLEFRDRLAALQAYISDLLEDSRTLRSGQPLSEITQPPIPPAPTVEKHGWWEAGD